MTYSYKLDYPDFTDGDLLKMYMMDAQRSNLLSAKEEIELAQQMEAGLEARAKLDENNLSDKVRGKLHQVVAKGEKARETVINSNIRLVISVAKKHRGRGLTFLDLIQEGNMGLMTAVRKYDYRVGTRFSTYATWWIRHAITRAIENKSRAIRIPSHMDKSVREIYKMMRSLEQLNGVEPSVDDLAQNLDIPRDDIEYLLGITQAPLSLEQPTNDDSDASLVDMLPDGASEALTTTVEQNMMTEEIEAGLDSSLSPREAEIVRLRFGLSGNQPLTLKEIGKMFSLTKERIRQIEKRALDKLRKGSEWGKLYLDMG